MGFGLVSLSPNVLLSLFSLNFFFFFFFFHLHVMWNIFGIAQFIMVGLNFFFFFFKAIYNWLD